jgi:hypothetical protein
MGMAMHGKDREAIEDRRDAMSGSLFSSEVVGRAFHQCEVDQDGLDLGLSKSRTQ